MIIKTGDILYRYRWEAISDKDYCTDELMDKYDCSVDCPNYKKCNQPKQKITLTKVTITKRTFKPWKKSEILHYNAQDLKYWKPKVGNFKNSSFTTPVKISPRKIEEWSKSESAALKKVNTRLKERIKKIKNKTLKYILEFEIPLLPKYVDLQKKIEIKIKANKCKN